MSENDIVYEYDLNGNLVRVIGSAHSALYEYNAENKLVKATVQNGSLVIEESYTYDYEGNRTSKTTHKSNGEFEYTKYLNDNSSLTNVLAEIDENGTAKCTYTIGADLVSQERDGKVSVYLYDGHGSVVGLANESGVVTDTYSYDAFGNLLKSTGETDNNYLYCGEQFDETTRLYYLRTRYMDTSTGRFISQDSYQGNTFEPDTLHKYLYANSNPVVYSDPSGYSACPDWYGGCNIIDISWRAVGGNEADIITLQTKSTSDDMRYYSDPLYMGIYVATVITVGVILLAALTAVTLVYTSYLADVATLGEWISDGNLMSPELACRIKNRAIKYCMPSIAKFPASNANSDDESEDDSGWIIYFGLDSLGRATGAVAKITSNMVGTGTPPTIKVPGTKQNGISLDRGHLIAANLGGSGREPRNLTPLYHSTNAGKMESTELKIATDVLNGANTYMYVYPVYEGNNLVPIKVEMYYCNIYGYHHVTIDNKPYN